ncbi:MAG: hypothetical protein LW817_03070 [Candidatus Caenarcaniphilales bacterium]|jgi:hypothetical protein|nr:hypothetical protein [Candidatus Caenarcaniphilales bacterium]
MGYNPSKDYSKNAFNTNQAQINIANIEDQYQRAILGEGPLEQDELRDQMAKMKALLGEIRVRAQEVVQETKNELDARKGLAELAKG